MKKAVSFGLAALLILGWMVTVQGLTERPAEFNRLMEEANRYESEEIYVKAIECYKQALQYKPDSFSIQFKMAQDYLALGNEAAFINQCNALNSQFKYPPQSVVLQTDYYVEKGLINKAIPVLTEALKIHGDDAEIVKRYEKLRYTFTEMYLRFDEFGDFRNDSAVVVSEGRYGLLGSNGKNILKCRYDWLGAQSNDRSHIPVLEDGEFYFADTNGYRVEVPREGQKVEKLGVLCNGCAPAKINGKYGYINETFEELTPFEWDGATVIQSGVGAVKKGDKWALVNSDFQVISEYQYDEIAVDEHGYCSISGRVFAKTQTGYVMLDSKGNRVGDAVFEDARPFFTKEPTAVMIGGKWGFANMDGTVVIEPLYEDARPFSSGLAPVKQGGAWGYITQDKTMAIEAGYTEARCFYKGLAPVQTGNQWKAIELNIH